MGIGARLGRIVAVPLVTTSVLAAGLLWELEHVGSVGLAILIAAIGVGIAVAVARRVRRNIDDLSDRYEMLLAAADDASRQAEAASRLKDEFLGTVSHELRTPLNSVLGWTRLLLTGKLGREQTANALAAIERAGWTQSRLIEGLLDLSQIVGGRLHLATRPTSVQPLVEAAVESLMAAASARRLTVSVQLDPSIGPTTADPDRFQQIVWQLVSNAIKFTPMGGRVDVRLAREGDHIRLTVADTGVGFASDVAEHLFERLRQGDSSSTRPYGGLGLGLAIVRHLVELHGGTVRAHSAGPNCGSAFEIRIPIRTPEIARRPETAATGTPFLRGVSVLVVDDDPADLDFARASLEQFGASVVTARSADQARETFADRSPDVLVCDLLMPGRDGFELIRDIRNTDRGRDTPACAFTGLARTEDRRRALAAGFQMHLTKPIDPIELAATVERLALDVVDRSAARVGRGA
jgi:signal transduction histidine kinase/CheY-like chemotaxis protein